MGIDGRATVKVASVRDTRSSARYVSRHNMCTKGTNDLGFSGAGDRVALV